MSAVTWIKPNVEWKSHNVAKVAASEEQTAAVMAQGDVGEKKLLDLSPPLSGLLSAFSEEILHLYPKWNK